MAVKSFLSAVSVLAFFLMSSCATIRPDTYVQRDVEDVCDLVVDPHVHLLTARDFPSEGVVLESQGVKSKFGRWLVAGFVRLPKRYTPVDSQLAPEGRAFAVFSPETRRMPRIDVGWLKSFWAGNLRLAGGATKSRTDKALLLFHLYPEVDLFTPILVDFDGWAGREADQSPLPVRIRALSNIADAVNARFPGLMHPVVAVNPLRMIEESPYYVEGYREMIAQAVFRFGFVGIKIYPSNGFRPARNGELPSDLLPKPSKLSDFRIGGAPIDTAASVVGELTRDERKRYRRYLAYRIDEELEWLYAFAERNEVPIFTHSSEVGVALGRDFSELYGRPEYWAPVLWDHPHLRLNLGHFGKGRQIIDGAGRSPQSSCFDEAGWESGVTQCEWLDASIFLVSSFPNVYVDTSHDGVSSEDFGLYIYSLSLEMKRNHVLRRRVMYGSDFYMLVQDKNYFDYFDRYSESLDIYLEQYRADILGTNAVRYLGLDSGKNRSRLRDYYRNRRYKLPTWLETSGSTCR